VRTVPDWLSPAVAPLAGSFSNRTPLWPAGQPPIGS